ncbi:MAG: HD domain-containing protein [Chitinivibrionales bacterium]|nr:HD domain-containing protein [Chitinivibrionales bacterium]
MAGRKGSSENAGYQSSPSALRKKSTTSPSYRNYQKLQKRVDELEARNQDLEKMLRKVSGELDALKARNAEMLSSYALTVYRLAVASEYMDKSIRRHIMRMGKYSAALASIAGFSSEDVAAIELAAPMHDIGKAAVPNEILMKTGRLSVDEFALVKLHTVTGGNMLADSDSKTLNLARKIALTHHEKWNGTGYPVGLKKTKIPLIGRIVGIVDTFDVLTSPRPHKDAYPIEVAVDIICDSRGKQFDPSLVDCFHDNVDTLIRIKAGIDRPENLPTYNFVFSERDRN